MGWRDVKLCVVLFLGTAAALAVLVFAIALAIYPLERASCDAHWPSIEHRYSLFGDCQLKTASGWIPEKNYRENRSAQ